MAFSPSSVHPPLVCVASDHASVHVFRLSESPFSKQGIAQAVIHSMIPKPPSLYGGGEKVDIVKLQKSCLKGTPIACALRVGKDGILKLSVVSQDGILYVYSLENIDDRERASSHLENEFVISSS